MFGNFFATVGGLIGKSLGGGILSTIGRFAGNMLWKYIEAKTHLADETHDFQNIRDSFAFSQARYGEPIPLLFGTARVNGKIIWAMQVREVANTTTDKQYFPVFREVKSINRKTECEYYLSFAVAICEGEIAEIMRVWANGELIDLGNYNHRLYLGKEDQLPDPLIAEVQGKAPAFRDLAYIVFTNLPLADFNHTVPNFSFEVLRKANIAIDASVEDAVKSIVMIPGSGEFVYDTNIQYKTIITNPYEANITKRNTNSHNYKNIADSVYSLNQLQIVCPNVEWVAVVVCWFGDNTDISKCLIRPAVEFNDKYVKYSEQWRVGKYVRSSAYVISKDINGNPLYGGSVNDASVVRYLQELKRRNLKIMFYPMPFLDVHQKPWRGHMTGRVEDVAQFFHKEEGYNNFILHYTKLVKDHVDAFVIGSELIGLTKIHDENQQFPAVTELCKLTKQVKIIVGDRVAVTYAADWSEYHHTEGGWYNLDPLWSSPYIDFIGIDAYFPVTRTTSSNVSFEDILRGWQTGEGYDYYIEHQTQHSLSRAYAWKNLRFWWENHHTNPDNVRTSWQPKMKKIWFTEFGFPSIDKATNQPNVFFDPNSIDGGMPRHSSGEIDFSIQRKAIRGFIEYWQTQEYIGQMFLWTWDARPYPAWPHMNLWRDGYLWEKGHWVNNKFGAASVAAIILELSMRAGIALERVNVATLDEAVEGIIFNKDITIIDAINVLRIGYFFDISASNGEEIKFTKRGQRLPYPISESMLMQLPDGSYFELQQIADAALLSKVELSFIDRTKDYEPNYHHTNSENTSHKHTAKINLTIALSVSEADRLCKLILRNARYENMVVNFILPITYLECEPTDFVTFSYLNHQYQIRIVNIKLDNNLRIEVTGIVDDVSSYYLPVSHRQQNLIYEGEIDDKLLVLDLPCIFENMIDENYLTIYYYGKTQKTLYATLGEDYVGVASVSPSGDIGTCSLESSRHANIFLIDELSTATIEHRNFMQYVTNGWNLALCGAEIVKFSQWVLVRENTYRISSFIRGCFATENELNNHQIGEQFVLLDSYALLLPVSPSVEYSTISFKLRQGLDDFLQKIVFQNKASKLLPVFIDSIKLDQAKQELQIIWRMRLKSTNNWRAVQVAATRYMFEVSIFTNNASYNFTVNEQKLILDLVRHPLDATINVVIVAHDQLSNNSSLPSTMEYRI